MTTATQQPMPLLPLRGLRVAVHFNLQAMLHNQPSPTR